MRTFFIAVFLFISIRVQYSQYVPEWVRLHSFQSNFKYDSRCVCFDNENNIYLASYLDSFSTYSKTTTRKFDANGNLVWTREYPISGADSLATPLMIQRAANGNIYVIGNAGLSMYDSSSLFILSYSPNGDLIKYITYRNRGSSGILINDATVDIYSNIYVTGSVVQSQTLHDSLFIGKFDANLFLQWKSTYSTIANFAAANSLTLDPAGNIYLTGGAFNNNRTDIVIQKYSPSGVLLWNSMYGYNQSLYNMGLQIVLDMNQNLIVAGNTRLPGGGDSIHTMVLKYNNSGQLQWANAFDISNGGIESPLKILTENNNLYVHTYTQMSPRYRLLKLNSAGAQQWVYNYENNPLVIGFDPNDKIYSAGYQTANSKNLLSVHWINFNGTLDKVYNYSYDGTGSDAATCIKFLSNGNLMLTGNHFSNFIILKLLPSYSNTVNFCRHSLNKPISDSSFTYDTINLSLYDLPAGATLKDINVTLDSIIHTAAGDLEITLIHNSLRDTLVYRRGAWFDNFIGTVLNDSAAQNICEAGLPPFTGSFRPCNPLSKFNYLQTSGNWILQVYDRRAPDTGYLKSWCMRMTYELPIGIDKTSDPVPNEYVLCQNYPNPFNPETKIRFDIPPLEGARGWTVNLVVYDIIGQEVTVLVNENLKSGVYEVTWNAENYPSGVYFYQLTASGFTQTNKMVLLK